MADLSNLGMDVNVQENTGEGQVFPGGYYDFVIIELVLDDNKKKNGKTARIKHQIIAGPHTGGILKDVINLTNPSQMCAQIGQGVMKRICNLCSVPYPPTDTTALYGKPMRGRVEVGSFVGSNGDKIPKNDLKSYGPVQAAGASQEPPLANPPGETVPNEW